MHASRESLIGRLFEELLAPEATVHLQGLLSGDFAAGRIETTLALPGDATTPQPPVEMTFRLVSGKEGPMDHLRQAVLDWIALEVASGSERAARLHLAGAARAVAKGRDVLFRSAPHVVVVHATPISGFVSMNRSFFSTDSAGLPAKNTGGAVRRDRAGKSKLGAVGDAWENRLFGQ